MKKLESQEVYHARFVAIATGHHAKPSYAEFPGQDTFTGKKEFQFEHHGFLRKSSGCVHLHVWAFYAKKGSLWFAIGDYFNLCLCSYSVWLEKKALCRK